MAITYVIGDATSPQASGAKIIAHVCNDIGGWGAGFVMALSAKWTEPESEYRSWHERVSDPPFELGQVQFVEVEPQLWIANLIGQRDVRSRDAVPPVRYEAIRTGMERIAKFAMDREASVHMPRIGCGLAGGEWSKVEAIIEQTLCVQDIAVTVYDLPSNS